MRLDECKLLADMRPDQWYTATHLLLYFGQAPDLTFSQLPSRTDFEVFLEHLLHKKLITPKAREPETEPELYFYEPGQKVVEFQLSEAGIHRRLQNAYLIAEDEKVSANR